MFPYICINVMLYLASKYSQLWDEYVVVFLLLIGLLITNITGNLNLKSSARMRLNPVYLDPFVFCLVLYFDYNRLLPLNLIKLMYVGIMVNRLVSYVLFVKGMVDQICEFLDIPFLIVKADYVSKKKKA